MSGPVLEITDSPDPADEVVIDGGLGDFNDARGGVGAVRRLAVISREGERVVGGLLGRTSGRMFEVQIIWVDEDLRGEGRGAAILAAAEAEARRRGCTFSYLDTFTFQAPDFYARSGYEELLRIGPFDRDVVKIHMGKKL